MTCNPPANRLTAFAALGQSGTPADVDQLMRELSAGNDMATAKVVDYALSLVTSREGITALRDYLFTGDQTQRNYAALFFKRKGRTDLIDQAYQLGLIDDKQAYLK